MFKFLANKGAAAVCRHVGGRCAALPAWRVETHAGKASIASASQKGANAAWLASAVKGG